MARDRLPWLRLSAFLMLSGLVPVSAWGGQSGTACPPAVGDRAGNYIVPGVLGDVEYTSGLTLDAYAPKGDPRPAAVIVPSAGGSKRTQVTQIFEVLDQAGYAWFSLDYRSAADVAKALDFIGCPGRFNITPKRILIGVDTGAEIALRAARVRRPDGAVLFSPKFDKLGRAGSGTENPASAPTAGLDFPIAIFQGAADDEPPPAPVEAFCKRLPKCTYQAVPGAIHDFENWHPDQWSWKEDLGASLRDDRRGLWKDIAYARPGGRPLLMDAWLPEGRGPFPAVIIAHGGGWEAGDKVTYVSPVFEPLSRAGFAWFSIDYRLTPYVRVPDELEDLRSAIRYVRQHADRFHVDPNRVALLGESASGHLVAQVASEPCSGCGVQAVVSFYGVYDFAPWASPKPQPSSDADQDEERRTLDRLFGDWTPEILRRYSPIDHVSPGLPPLLLIQGTKDELYPGTIAYADRLKHEGARYDLVLVDGAPHGMENWEGHPEWMFYKQKLVSWLGKVLSGR
jgi:alpha-L-fucosidase 2